MDLFKIIAQPTPGQRLEEQLARLFAPISPIRKIPTEILLIIFRFCLIPNSRIIRRLLLVCKVWKGMIMNTPSLWTSISVPFDKFIEHSEDPDERFIAACLKRSGSLLLHLSINFRIPEPEGKPRDNGWYTQQEGHINRSLKALSILSGNDQGLMRRWGTLVLILPGYQVGIQPGHRVGVREIWKSLAIPTPNLTHLTLEGIDPSSHLPYALIAHRSITIDDRSEAFTNLRSLTHLTIKDPLNNEIIKHAPPSLQYLSMRLFVGKEQWDLLAPFRLLQQLEIHGGWLGMHTLRVSLGTNRALQFPALRSITFIGDFLQDIPDIEAPRLQDLCLTPSRVAAPRFLPSLHPTKSLRWSIDPDGRKQWEEEIMEEFLRSCVLQYSSVETIELEEFAEVVFGSVIADIHEREQVPSSLKKVYITASSGDIRSLDIDAILAWL